MTGGKAAHWVSPDSTDTLPTPLCILNGRFRRASMSAEGRVRKRVSGIEAEVQVTAARAIAVARGCMSTTAYGPDTAFR